MYPQKAGFLHTMACLRAKKSAILGTLAENRACSGAQIWYTKSRKSPGGPVRKSEGKHHGRLSGIPAAGAAQALAQAVEICCGFVSFYLALPLLELVLSLLQTMIGG